VIIEDTSRVAQSVSFLYKKLALRGPLPLQRLSLAILSAPLDRYFTASPRLVLVYGSDKTHPPRRGLRRPIHRGDEVVVSGVGVPARDVAAIRTHKHHKAGKAAHSQ
jgi:hypothetical protein